MLKNKTHLGYATAYNTQRELAEKMFKDSLQMWADDKCPYKVGETYTVPECAFSQEGKKFRVERVNTYHWLYDRYEWTIIGRIMKKDGTIGLRIVNFRVPIDMED